jgi:hypothetical protein
MRLSSALSGEVAALPRLRLYDRARRLQTQSDAIKQPSQDYAKSNGPEEIALYRADAVGQTRLGGYSRSSAARRKRES